MIGLPRSAARAIAAAFLLITSLGAAHAAGALAVGVCGAYGYGYDFRNLADARVAAMRRCSGKDCKIVGTIQRGCAAVAVDAKRPCGSFGWAIVRILAAPKICRCAAAMSSAARTAWSVPSLATRRADRKTGSRFAKSAGSIRNDRALTTIGKLATVFRKDRASNKEIRHDRVRLNWITTKRYLSGRSISSFFRTPSSKIQP
jgi:hypothetical protein